MDTYWSFISGALRLDPAAFRAIDQSDHGLRQALVILLIAGASETLGQSVVLVLNRVSRGRFFLALLLGGVELILEALVWIVSVWILGGILAPARPPFFSAVRVIGLAFAPLVLGVFVFFPYIGPPIGRLLRLWVLLAAVVGISVVFGVTPWLAALIAVLGFLGRWLLLRVFGGVGDAVGRWFWRASTGLNSPLLSSDPLLSLGPQDHAG
ncbi:MAG: hypothetical protein JO057_21080 [Chloroflexi bacterium]|nr:hypothetical protein [Chloroflexota bacterium]